MNREEKSFYKSMKWDITREEAKRRAASLTRLANINPTCILCTLETKDYVCICDNCVKEQNEKRRNRFKINE